MSATLSLSAGSRKRIIAHGIAYDVTIGDVQAPWVEGTIIDASTSPPTPRRIWLNLTTGIVIVDTGAA